MKDATDITVILDRSGSMESIKTDTIGGFNRFLDDQKKVPGECRVTLIQFDSQNPQEVVIDAAPIASASPLTEQTFVPRASTPLFDALGQSIVRTGERFAALPEDERPDKVYLVIITDGHENASMEYTRERVFAMIREQSDAYKWQFVYLGANQDAMKVGQSIGISSKAAMTYTASDAGVQNVYGAMSISLATSRAAGGATMAFSDEQRRKALAGPKKKS